jgi:hypothetical protein
MPSVELDIDAGDMSDEELNTRIAILGELIISEVKKNIRKMDLIGSGQLLQRWFADYSNGVLTIDTGTKYGYYIEYGTYEYFDQYGLEDYPEVPDPKKKDLLRSLRSAYPSGMQPFSPVRRVLYNPTIMERLAKEAFR